jgi:flagellar motor switch protein FliG
MATGSENQNLHKAAVLLRCLTKEQRTRLLAKLDAEQAAAVTAELNGLGEIGDEEQELVVREFAGLNTARPADSQPVETAPFQFLADLPAEMLRELVSDEHPQAIALVLAHLPPRKAAAVLAELTPEQQLPVVCRMAVMSDVDAEIVGEVEEGLRRRLSGVVRRMGSHGVASVVRILNLMEPATERRLLANLAEADPELVQELRRAMFGAEVAACEEWETAEAVG